jgi:hypothetical protein
VNSIYGRFEFTARVKRENDSNYANYLIVRAGSSVLSSNSRWVPNYMFGYTNGGYYSIWKVNSAGAEAALQTWTYSTKILPYTWNTLKVYGNGSTFRFYINGTLVWTITDPTLTQGYVGVQMAKGATAGKFLVDWATLTIPATASALDADTVSAEQEALNQAAMKAGVKGSSKGYLVE